MIEETIRAVKMAEAQADMIIDEAREKADQIVKDAQAEAARSDIRSREEAQDSRRQQLSAARSEADKYLENQMKQAGEEAAGIREAAAAKEEAAIESVVRIILS